MTHLPTAYCTGDPFCVAEVHIHGCYADQGECTEPEAHL